MLIKIPARLVLGENWKNSLFHAFSHVKTWTNRPPSTLQPLPRRRHATNMAVIHGQATGPLEPTLVLPLDWQIGRMEAGVWLSFAAIISQLKLWMRIRRWRNRRQERGLDLLSCSTATMRFGPSAVMTRMTMISMGTKKSCCHPLGTLVQSQIVGVDPFSFATDAQTQTKHAKMFGRRRDVIQTCSSRHNQLSLIGWILESWSDNVAYWAYRTSINSSFFYLLLLLWSRPAKGISSMDKGPIFAVPNKQTTQVTTWEDDCQVWRQTNQCNVWFWAIPMPQL